ncbi:MAG: hypothetical protein K8Q91_00775 [Candidatus Vogelbacteria bacterium]|nr:hypothetical protein [Candidatus Vogelbacteria bacterium]
MSTPEVIITICLGVMVTCMLLLCLILKEAKNEQVAKRAKRLEKLEREKADLARDARILKAELDHFPQENVNQLRALERLEHGVQHTNDLYTWEVILDMVKQTGKRRIPKPIT